MVPYDPNSYWMMRGEIYKQTFQSNAAYKLQEDTLIEFLEMIPFSTVLEVGCGFGRITKLVLEHFPHITKYEAIDISVDQICNMMRYVRDGRLWSVCTDFRRFEPNETYDLVLASEFLMHMFPSEIKQIMFKMVRLSNLHIVNVDWQDEDKHNYGPEDWCFIHNYEKIYKDIESVDTVKKVQVNNQALFYARKKILEEVP